VESAKGVKADGSPMSGISTFAITGGEVRYPEGGPPAGISEVLANRKRDSRSADFTRLRDGKVIRTEHDVVSEDGKTIWVTFKGTDAQGKPYETVEVWDRM
jgi:hypothetical protein